MSILVNSGKVMIFPVDDYLDDYDVRKPVDTLPLGEVSVGDAYGDVFKAFLAPWVLCRFGFGKHLLSYLLRNADLVGRKYLFRNKHLSSEHIHKLVVGSHGLSAIEFQALSSHPNMVASDVAHLLLDDKTHFIVQYYSSNYVKGLHFLRDSGVDTEYEAYCSLAMTGAVVLDEKVDQLNAADIHSLINSEDSITHGDAYEAFDWRRRNLIDLIVRNDDRFDVLIEVVTCVQASRDQREDAYAKVKASPEFLFSGMPEDWARKASGMLPAVKEVLEDRLF